MKTKIFLFFVIISVLIIVITRENGNVQSNEDSKTTIVPIVQSNDWQKLSRVVGSVAIIVPTPSKENAIQLSPPPPPIDPDFLALRENLQREIDNSCCDVTVSVTDLQTGKTIDVKGDQPRLPGCTMNFFVLLSVVMDLQSELYPESEVGNIISKTIWSSNAVTARDLLIETGGGDVYEGLRKVNNLLAFLGLKTGPSPVIMDHPPAYPHESLSGEQVDNSITANQVNYTLAQLWGNLLSSQWRDYFLGKLTGVKPGLNYLIPAGVGEARVSHKNGFFWDITGWVDNDIGIVSFEKNGKQYAYVLSLYMEKIPYKYADIPIGQIISRLVWEYFSTKYQ